jgi:hypothetical protein
MWDQINRSDVELARQKLAELRRMTLQRHAEELNQLDAEDAEIDTLERLASSITEKYLNGRAPTGEEPASDAIQDTGGPTIDQQPSPPAILEVGQNVTPNFGGPLRRFVRG